MIKKSVIGLIIIGFLLGCAQDEPEPEPVEESVVEEVDPEAHINRLNGSYIEDHVYHAVAVMIGNTSHARPQSGLSLADVVYEISVETMTITRYMAIFGTEYPDKVGPIRSVRLPFVTMLDEWDVGFAHFGGASVGKGDALTPLENMYVPIRYDGVLNVNTEFFSRDPNRVAPHNAYMDLEEASEELPDMWPRKHFTFSEDAVYVGDDATEVKIQYTSDIRNGYVYDPELGRYMKYLNGKEHIDDYTDEPIYVTNIVVQHADHKMVEKAKYVLVNFYFYGEAEYFIGGKHFTGRWVKDYPEDTTHFYDEDDNEIQFTPGNTWIHIVPKEAKISYE